MKPLSLSTRTLICAAVTAALASVSCTTRNQEAPPLTGPSEYGTSITITVSPDVLTQDGASQSLVTITARDHNGNLLRNQAVRAEIFLDGERVDFGSLSARNLVTDNNGQATLVFTAPASPGGPSVDTGTVVQIVVTPVGSDFGNTMARRASIRLVPPGSVAPPDGLQPRFTFTPASPEEHQDVFFNASSSTSTPNNPISTYTWTFGDGAAGSGPQATHEYNSAGVYHVTLTITDGFGRSAQTSNTVIVSAAAVPTAAFVFSPTEPRVNTQVNFNGSASSANTPGRTVARYTWDFGDGSPLETTGPTTSHVFTRVGTFRVTLVVTDDAGTASRGTTQEVEIGP